MLILSKILQVILSIGIVGLVLIQSKSTGLASGVKSSFGSYRSLRGVERMVFILTVLFGVLLLVNSVLLLTLQN